MDEQKINALKQALEFASDNHALRLTLAEALETAERPSEALDQYTIVIEAKALAADKLITVGLLAVTHGRLPLAQSCLDQALAAGVLAGTADLQQKIDAKKEADGLQRLFAPPQGGAEEDSNEVMPLDIPADNITFADVGGMDDIKKVIHKMIILPVLKPEIYAKYGRRSGGGVLLYGPPGCGKTMLARATAGECQLPFINIRIEEILDPYIGMSERNLHRFFNAARLNAPCVIFIDEIDAIGFARRRQSSSHQRGLVDQLLQELDSIGSDNDSVLVLAATNAPWDVDDALMRPGRFDRRIFVPPPDHTARQKIMQMLTADIPTTKLNYRRLANNTPLFSGADLQAAVNGAVDQVIDEALAQEKEIPVAMPHFESALAELRPTTLDWLNRAQNYVEFANADQRYEDVSKFLRSREVRRNRK